MGGFSVISGAFWLTFQLVTWNLSRGCERSRTIVYINNFFDAYFFMKKNFLEEATFSLFIIKFEKDWSYATLFKSGIFTELAESTR